MDNGLLILKRIVNARKKAKEQKLPFHENQKCAIAISGIKDKHEGIKPSIIECFSVPDLYAKLRFILDGMPPYEMVLDWVKEHGYVQVIKTEINGQIRYRA